MTSETKSETELPATGEESKPRDPVRRWTFIVLALSIVLTVLYLFADRHTPFTTQARVHAYVVPIAAEVGGTVVAVDVGNNQMVAAGQRLFQVDPGNYELAVKAAEAALQTAIQSVESGTSDVASTAARVESARASVWRAEQDALRMRRIREEDPGAISERRLESAEATLASARSQLAAAESALLAARSQLGETGENNAQLRQARSNLDQAKLNLERTTVRAPRDGMITDLRIDQGNFAAAGAPLMTFIAIHDTWVQADLTENNLGHVDAGDPVELTFDVFPGKVFPGQVRRTGYGVQVSSNALGTLPTIDNQRNWLRDAQRFPVAVDFERGRLDPADLRVGSQASVIVYSGDHWLLNLLGKIYIRAAALLSYAY